MRVLGATGCLREGAVDGLREKAKELSLNYDGVLSGLRKSTVLGCAGSKSTRSPLTCLLESVAIRQGRLHYIVHATARGGHPLSVEPSLEHRIV